MPDESKAELQRIFDTVWNGAKAQDFQKSTGLCEVLCTNISMCRYRSGTGLKCNAGHLILDEHYQSSFEGWSLTQSAVVQNAIIKSGYPCELGTDTFWAIATLQKAHDSSGSPKAHEAKLRLFARKRGLTVPEHDSAPI